MIHRIDSERLRRAIEDLPDQPEPDGFNKRPLLEGANIYDVAVDGLTHGVLYDIVYDEGSRTTGLVRIKNVLDGNVYRWGFAEGDPRSD